MKGYSTKQILADDWLPANYNELVKVYRTLAKSADQRLVRLESYQHDKAFKTATQWAYKRAMHDIEQWSGAEAKRFNTAPPASETDLISKIQDIKHFLESPTSTKQGIIKVYQKRAESLNKTMKEKNPKWKDLTWKDMAQYFDSALHEKLDAEYGSKTKVKIFAALKKNKKQILEDIEEKKNQHMKVDDEVLQTTIENVIDSYPSEVKKLLKAI